MELPGREKWIEKEEDAVWCKRDLFTSLFVAPFFLPAPSLARNDIY